jgi:hypothetical protein
MAGRHVLDEAPVLLVVGDQGPGGRLAAQRPVATQDRAEQHQSADLVGMQLGEPRRRHGSPRMGDDRDRFGAGFLADEGHGPLDLADGVLGPPQRRFSLGSRHARIALRPAIAGEVQAEGVVALVVQRIGPRFPVEPEHHRQGRREARAMDIEDRMRAVA